MLNRIFEGRYDSITNEISSYIFKQWKKDFIKGSIESVVENDFSNKDLYIEILAKITFIENYEDVLRIDGGADDDYIEVNFKVDSNRLPKYWEQISMWLKDLIRHEIEHLTQTDGENSIRGKKMEDDQDIRNLITRGELPKSEYFKLPKEVDANLQGLYIKAKKSKRTFKEVVDDYLDGTNIDDEDKEAIKNLWRKRARNLGLNVQF